MKENNMKLKIEATITNIQMIKEDNILTSYKHIFEFKSDGKRYEGSFIADEVCSTKVTIIVPLYFADHLRKEGTPICLINNLEIMTYNCEQPCFETGAKVKYKKDSKVKKQIIDGFSINYIL